MRGSARTSERMYAEMAGACPRAASAGRVRRSPPSSPTGWPARWDPSVARAREAPGVGRRCGGPRPRPGCSSPSRTRAPGPSRPRLSPRSPSCAAPGWCRWRRPTRPRPAAHARTRARSSATRRRRPRRLGHGARRGRPAAARAGAGRRAAQRGRADRRWRPATPRLTSDPRLGELAAPPDSDPRVLTPTRRPPSGAAVRTARRWADQVAALGLPVTLNHNDLHGHNVFARRARRCGSSTSPTPCSPSRSPSLLIPLNVLSGRARRRTGRPPAVAGRDAALEVWSDWRRCRPTARRPPGRAPAGAAGPGRELGPVLVLR